MNTFKLLLIALLFVAFPVNRLYSQWSVTSNYPAVPGFYDQGLIGKVYFINTQTGFALGEVTFWEPQTQCQNTGPELIRTSDGGATWTPIFSTVTCPGGPLFPETDIFFLNSQTGYLGTYNLRKTTNAGLNWSFVNTTANLQRVTGIAFPSEQTGYVTSMWAQGRIYKTTNGGSNWVQQYTGDHLYKIRFIDVNTGLACSRGGKILRTVNGGANWNEILTGANDTLKDIAFVSLTAAYITGSEGTNGKIYRSTDAGASWSAVVTSTASLNTISFANPTTGYAAGEIYYRTTDGGASWQSHASSFPGSSRVLSLHFVTPDTGYAAGPDKVYKTITGGLTAIQTYSSEIPAGFRLHQNFPNPFNPTTVIRFDIPSGSKGLTELKIYDINGREVQLILSGSPAPGSYEYKWDASGMPAGLYFYKLSVQGENAFTEVKKMMLVK